MTGVSVTVAAIYYMFTLRINMKNQELSLKSQHQADETRQAQLFMQVYDPFRGKEFQKAFVDVRNMKFKDYQEFLEKYGSEVNPDLYASMLIVGN